MANIITSVRILCSIALLFVTPLSKLFYALYLTAGLSDMIDGTVARKTGTESDSTLALIIIAAVSLIGICTIKNKE